jgi:phosphate transport system substrate-binding protein
MRKWTIAIATFVSVVAVLSAGAQPQTIRVDGSSTVYPVTEAVAEEFQKENPNAKVTVGISGTGGGFKKFVRGEIDIADASRPILAKEMEEAKKNGIEYYELPVAFDALTVMVNPQNSWVQQMTVDELKKIWQPEAQGKVTTWKQVNASWPDAPLKLFGAGSDSGTFDYFTEAIVGKAKSSRGDYTASEDDNVLVQGIAGDKNALGYFGFAYYVENKDKLKAVPIVNSQTGSPVMPSAQAVNDGSYQPLSRPIFIYVNKKSYDTRPEVKKFVEFYLENGGDLAKEVKYVPLPDAIYDKCVQRIKQGQTGTVFAGHADVGVTINDLFTRQLTTEPKVADAK